MAEHLSEFALESLAVGDGSPPPHVESCEACRQRLDGLRARSRQLADSAGYARTLGGLETIERRAARAKPRVSRPWGWMSLAGVGLAAALFVSLRPSPSDVNGGIKGHPSIAVIRAGLHAEGPAEKIHLARPGDRVALEVGCGTASWLLVVAVDDASGGRTEVLWPAGGGQSAPAPQGAAVRLSPELTITPGSLTVRAIFSERPISLAEVQRAGVASTGWTTADWDVCVEGSPCPSP